MNLIILLSSGITVGFAFGYLIRKYLGQRQRDTAEARAKSILDEAKAKAKEELLSAKDKVFSTIESAKKEEEERRNRLIAYEERLEKREHDLEKRHNSLEYKERETVERSREAEAIKRELLVIKKKQLANLEKIAKLDMKKAREILLEEASKESKERLYRHIKKLEEEEKEEIKKKAKKMLALSLERQASSVAPELTSTTVGLPSDEMKGRIIGREGRNIKMIERLTGTEIIVDDTPEVITVSGFSPIRRHVAKKTLDMLIADGRIHPGRVEEAVEQAKKEISQDIKNAGEEACFNVGVAGLDPKLVQLLGRLKYRSSYGQNVLQHSCEVAHIGEVLADELGADRSITKKAGLLHDIGKAVDSEIQGTHVEIGKSLAEKFGLSKEVIHAIEAHHEDVEPKTLEAMIVATADAISAGRMGARKDTYENYIKRLEELEGIASDFEGVEKSYAIQAGREIRIFVVPDKVDDLKALKLSRAIADKIEKELKYPGEIKVNVIRETRAVEYAR